MRLTIFLKEEFENMNHGSYHMDDKIWCFDMKIFKLCKDGQSAINSLVTKQRNIISRLKPLEVEFGQCTCRSGIDFSHVGKNRLFIDF